MRRGRLASLALLLAAGPGPAAAHDPPWPTFQGNPSHDGHVAVRTDPATFLFQWRVEVVPGLPLNPVAAADGMVFVSARNETGPDLLCLAGDDGRVLWSHELGDVWAVDPPAWGHGRVYVQTSGGATPALLRVFDAATGAFDFQVYNGSQWRQYWAPTVLDGRVYVGAGYHGGIASFDAFDRIRYWELETGSYDEWTPAAIGEHVFGYRTETPRGLVRADRATGLEAGSVADPGFVFPGTARLELAPVLGGMGDVLVIQGGRLLRFDLVASSISYELQGSFSGQPVSPRAPSTPSTRGR